MKLNSTNTRRGGLMLAVAIVSLCYYGILILKEIRNRRRPAPPQSAEYYNVAAGAMPSQWGRRSSTVCGPGGCVTVDSFSSPSTTGDHFTGWVIPAYSNEPWIYRINGLEAGRVDPNGTLYGFVDGLPGHWPSNMPPGIQARAQQSFQQAAQAERVERTTTPGAPAGTPRVGDLPPPGSPYAGQASPVPDKKLPPTGVDKDKLADDKARIPGGLSINGQPQSEALVRDRLSDSAKAQGLKDYENALRLVVVGHNDSERKAFINIAKPLADASEGKLIIQEFDDADWQVKAHTNAAKSIPDYEQGKPFAYLQRSTGAVKAIMFTPSEVAHVIKQHRPEVAPNFDAAKARALATQSSNDWLIWASAAFVAFCGLVGAVTSKS